MEPTTSFLRSRAVNAQPFTLESTYVHLKDSGVAAELALAPDFWATAATRPELQAGRLVGTGRLEQDPPHWEMHPAGDELLVLLSGRVELVLQDGRGERVIELRAGQAFVVPFGVWHRLRVKTPGEILFVTPGKGSQHRPR